VVADGRRLAAALGSWPFHAFDRVMDDGDPRIGLAGPAAPGALLSFSEVDDGDGLDFDHEIGCGEAGDAVFRFNRRRIRHAAFRSLLGIAAGHASFNYKMLISPEAKP